MSLSHAEIRDSNRDSTVAIINELHDLSAKLNGISSLTGLVKATLVQMRVIGLLLLRHVIDKRDAKGAGRRAQ